MDGSASAILFIHAGGLKKNIHYVQAGKLDEAWEDSGLVARADPVLIVDLSPNAMELAREMTRRPNTYVIDHHKTAERFALLLNFTISIGNEACGCELFRRWLVSNGFHAVCRLSPESNDTFTAQHYKRFTRLIDDHDRWQLKIPFSIKLPVFFSFVGQSDFVERFMNVETRFGEEKDSYWTPFEQDLINVIEKRQESKFAKLLTKFKVRPMQFQGRWIKVGYLVDGVVNNSELLNRYLLANPEVDVACQINFDLDKVAFRSRTPGVDVSALAAQWGGGGHQAASGHSFPDGIVNTVIGALHG